MSNFLGFLQDGSFSMVQCLLFVAGVLLAEVLAGSLGWAVLNQALDTTRDTSYEHRSRMMHRYRTGGIMLLILAACTFIVIAL